MRILLHDYPGHAFPIQLSRELAARGHVLLHLYAGYNVTPRGDLVKHGSDPLDFHIAPVFIRRPLQKYRFFKRWLQEKEYGAILAREVQRFKPDVVISCQTPLDSQPAFQRKSKEISAGYIFWAQDVIGLATLKLLARKFSMLGRLIGRYYIGIEKRLLRKSDHIIVISDDFKQLFISWGIESDRITNIPNWASIEQIHPVDKNNSWSRRFLPNDGFIFMYTGTLGMKHNPEHLYRLAMHYRDNSRAYVVVISEGPGADWLLQRKSQHGLENLLIFPFQPYERLTEAMGAADVLIALLSLDAGAFSVPSKVLSYLCAQRPVLLAVPQENLAAKIVRRHHSGLVVPADDLDAFISAAEKLFSDPILREQFGKNGREYAEKNFGITGIGDRFENIINNLS